MKKKKKGFTLVELLAVIVILAVVILIAVTAVIPRINRAKKKALVDEALIYLKAAKEAYAIDSQGSNISKCYSVSDLNEEYINKTSDDYNGAIILNNNDGEITPIINLSDGKYYIYKTGNEIADGDVLDNVPYGYSSSCGNYNPVTSADAKTDTLAYKLLMSEGGSTIDENLAIINNRTSNVNYNNIEANASNSGLYVAPDNDGASYFYRGVINNNWVEFGGFYWRIIRINGDGSIRLLYSGTKNSTHTGSDAEIARVTYQDMSEKNVEVADISGLTNNLINITYHNGIYAHTYSGYMYNPDMSLMTYPSSDVGSNFNLNNFVTFTSINNSKTYYLFKNFDLNNDCISNSLLDGSSGTCILKCRELGDDCINTNWNTYATNTANYSTTDNGVYPSTNPTEYVYKSVYKYTCFEMGNPVTVQNSDNTTSVYLSCPVVTEIVGTVKNKSTQAKVKLVGWFSSSLSSSSINVKNSKVKITVEDWYENNILNKYDGTGTNARLLENYLSDEVFCSDRSIYDTSQSFYNTESFRFSPGVRLYSNAIKTPTYKCSNISNDGFTIGNVSTTSKVIPRGNGNGMLKYPVGLITADEMSFAGHNISTTNKSYYIYYGPSMWTMSPYLYKSGSANAYVAVINPSGKATSHSLDEQDGVRPVINLSPDVVYDSGEGTESSPYKVKLADV